ncbi:superfamily II DNA or RNA helicase [Rhodopirellula rubra]|uniref:Superfamily II DNA or RNA helicase n=1 Tax=Aporhodopirellula rubra TaxID=980271 RepID=A0A7W5H4J3_9BACT|nr:helicase-related protein [Aporhodopirellula rubra]MBB3205404.1 superfamily II DNA or RNA helicase [Aporhodopirellula rubra]
MLDADGVLRGKVEKYKDKAIAEMSSLNANEETKSNSSRSVSFDVNSSASPAEPDDKPDQTSASFSVGDIVVLKSDSSVLVPIIGIDTSGSEVRYSVFHEGTTAQYYESQLTAEQQPSAKASTLTAKELHAYLTSLILLSPSSTKLFSLRSGRVQFVPYQYRPVLKLVRADRPRLLIADEVGVGKTIEAGLIIKELKSRMDISSVLIICPKALVAERKWYLEMKRFDEQFTALDGSTLRHCIKETDLDGEWPQQYQKAIVPFSLFDSNLLFGREGKSRRAKEGLLSLDPPPKFDLVIVDEAHHLRNPQTFLHQGVRYFCENAEAVVFLSATPVQLGSEDLFTLLNVLRPDLVIDHASFNQMAAPNKPINAAVSECRGAEVGWQGRAVEHLQEAAETQWGKLFLRESPAFQSAFDLVRRDEISDHDRVAITRTIEELYTFSSLINRTRRRDIGEFTVRTPETLNAPFTVRQQELHDKLLDTIANILSISHGQQNVKFMMTTVRRQAASCLYGLKPLLSDILRGKLKDLEVTDESGDAPAELEPALLSQIKASVDEIISLAENLDPDDRKADELLRVLRDKGKMSNNKALLFTTFRHTLSYLAGRCEQEGLRFGVIHGGIPDEERADLRKRFSFEKERGDAIDVLLSSEVGCEGLDFQFCDLLVNYDLPWNPMRIEQRIGRIDRYGQKSQSVAIVNLITPGTVDAEIYERCLLRIGVFNHSVGGSEEILGEITEQLRNIEESFALTAEQRERQLQQLADNGIRRIQEEQTLESKQAELFGLNVPNQTWEREIEEAESFWLSSQSLQKTVEAYFANKLDPSGEYVLGEKPLKTLRLNQEARATLLTDLRKFPRSIEPVWRHWEKWLKGDLPTLSVTFDQKTAAENDGTTYLNVLHPLVRQAADALQRSGVLTVSLEVVDANLAPGEYAFAVYQWRNTGVKPDETLVAVCDSPVVEARLMTLLQMATDSTDGKIQEAEQTKTLDARHHSKWSDARAEHIARNLELVQHRIQSLLASGKARCQLLEDQINAATNDKITLMKQRELASAQRDGQRRLEDLKKSSETADIHAKPVVVGRLAITNETER